MYSQEEVEKAINTFIRFDHSYADTIRELGYPNRQTLWLWWKSYRENDHNVIVCSKREPKYSEDDKRHAVNYYLEHGKSISRTIKKLGYPKSREYLRNWIDELAPGERKMRQRAQTSEAFPEEKKIQIVAELEGRTGTASELAEQYNIGRTTAYVWRRELMKDYNHKQKTQESEKLAVSKVYDALPEDIETLKRMVENLRVEVRRLQIERDVHEAALEILKKGQSREPIQPRQSQTCDESTEQVEAEGSTGDCKNGKKQL